ncbi:MAG: TetR/AcrR family transcriptional regulator [Fulvivirga sp.]|uniref:TetR/AcrR family transcriptional regulator n=1 Tax=Fulvivirga sp. TaxID=1931237 RepID=UPI0032EAF9C0
MKKTSDKILISALNLFNEFGFGSVTLRQIAGDLNISQGNLNYHFLKKEDIVTSLYDKFSDEIEGLVQERLKENTLNLQEIGVFLNEVMELFLKYRFIFLDFARLMQEYPKIKARYVVLVEVRVEQFSAQLKELSERGILRPEAFPGQFRNLYKKIQILTDFWISYKSLEGKFDAADIQKSYLQMIQETIFPHMSDEYQKEWISTLSNY